MPVFHTRIIESILEPVAQQVSKLVILHEEAEDGNAMPDLARPVQVVKAAVDNLVKVGYETINNSEDAILKQDMPPALNRVEEASILLLQASELLRADPFSAPARKKLIEGSRGILQGTSALLLAFDESEVRKIIRICKNVLEYLAITEVVDSMEDLVTFVKNLSPVLTKMTKEVDAREKELTHQVHRDWLVRSLEQVKQLVPTLISGIKLYITTKDIGGRSLADAQHNRDYVVSKVSSEIHEIIRVLQLTTYDEDEWDADDITVMKKAESAIQGKMKQAQDWLADSLALPGSSGERALRTILEDALRVADRCINPDDRERILKAVGDIQSMVDALAELRNQGKVEGNSPQAMSLARGIQHKVHELADHVNTAVVNTERSGIRRPAHTVAGKVEQAQRWLRNPTVDDKGLGEEATRMVVAEARRVADSLPGHKRAELLQACNDADLLANQLSDMVCRGMGNTPQARAVAANLSQKLNELQTRIQDALVTQVADDFVDLTSPLKQLSEASMAPPNLPNREGIFEQKAARFEGHAGRLAQTARNVAAAGGATDKRTIEAINNLATETNDLTPQVVKAARIVLSAPGNAAAQEHFELLKSQWTENIEKLRSLVDEAVDTGSFIRACEEGILRDTDHTEQAIRNNDIAGVVNNTSSIARRSNRVLQVAQQEADNSEDPKFVENVQLAIRDLRNTITPMVQAAKGVAQNPGNQMAAGKWRGANQQLIDAVGGVRQAVGHDEEVMPNMNQLHISDYMPTHAPPPPTNMGGSDLLLGHSIDGLSEASDDTPRSLWNTAPLGIVKGPPGLKGAAFTVEGPHGSHPKIQVGQPFSLDLGRIEPKNNRNQQPFTTTVSGLGTRDRRFSEPGKDDRVSERRPSDSSLADPDMWRRDFDPEEIWGQKRAPRFGDGAPANLDEGIPVKHISSRTFPAPQSPTIGSNIFDLGPGSRGAMDGKPRADGTTAGRPGDRFGGRGPGSGVRGPGSGPGGPGYGAGSSGPDSGLSGGGGSGGTGAGGPGSAGWPGSGGPGSGSGPGGYWPKGGIGGPGASGPGAGETVSKGAGMGGPVSGSPGRGGPGSDMGGLGAGRGGPGAGGPGANRPGAGRPGSGEPCSGPFSHGGPAGRGPSGQGGPGSRGLGRGGPGGGPGIGGRGQGRPGGLERPGSGKPGAGGPGIGAPASRGPGAGGPGTGSPRTGGPGTGSPGQRGPGAVGPRGSGPGAGVPGGSPFGSPALGIKGAGEGGPVSGEPGSSGPGIGGPGSKVPVTGGPGSGVPGSGGPGSGGPGSGGQGLKDPGSGGLGKGGPGSGPGGRGGPGIGAAGSPSRLRGPGSEVPVMRATATPVAAARPPSPIKASPPPEEEEERKLPPGYRPKGGVPTPFGPGFPEIPPPPPELPLEARFMDAPPPPPPPPSGYYPYGDKVPPRPPLPRETAPPRPPPPETDDEDEMNFPTPQANQPIMMAAHALHMDVKQWSSRDNEIIAAAKRMALLMAKLSQLVRGEGGTKKDLIATAKAIAEASEEVTRLAKELARECTDKRMRTNLLNVCERIPTIGTQLKILSTVKATMLGAQGSEEDQEATEMLVGNAQNLMQSVRETVRAAEAASIKIRVDSGMQMNWIRKRPWYT